MKTQRKRRSACLFAVAVLVFAFRAGNCAGAEAYTPTLSDPMLDPWRWRVFPELNGRGLRSLVESRDGRIWFGVDDGVWSYDGYSWVSYTVDDGLPEGPINALCAAGDGSVYAASDLGIGRLRDGVWRTVFPPLTEATPSGAALTTASERALPWPVNRMIEASDGSVWAATGWGVLRLGAEGARLFTSREMGEAVTAQADYVRVTTLDDASVPERAWSSIHEPERVSVGAQVVVGSWLGAARGYAPLAIWKLAAGGPAENAGLRVGDRIVRVDGDAAERGLLFGFEGSSTKLRVFRPSTVESLDVKIVRRAVPGRVRDFSTHSLCEAADGSIWVGLSTWQEGGEVARLASVSGDWSKSVVCRLYTKKDGLLGRYNPFVAQTKDGTIWAASVGGVNMLAPTVAKGSEAAWKSFRMLDIGGTDEHTFLIQTRDSTVWLGGFDLQAYRNGTWHIYRSRAPEDAPNPRLRTLPFGVPWHRTRLLESSDGAVWVGGLGQSVARLDYDTGQWLVYERLHFAGEEPGGGLWFVSADSAVVRADPGSSRGRNTARWMRYRGDGLIDWPRAIAVAQDSTVWAVGSHGGRAAIAWFKNDRWFHRVVRDMGSGFDPRCVLTSRNGSLWLGPQPWGEATLTLGGLAEIDPSRFKADGQAWVHHRPPGPPSIAYAIAQTPDSLIWLGGDRLRRFDGREWTTFSEPSGLKAWVHALLPDGASGLWVGTRTYGVFHRGEAESAWRRFDVTDGLSGNTIKDLARTRDGTIWVATDGGISSFDGRTWLTHAFPEGLVAGVLMDNALSVSSDGTLWANLSGWRVVQRHLDDDPPVTQIEREQAEVSQPGNTIITWRGTDRWRATPDERLQYAWQLDGSPWSVFGEQKIVHLTSLSTGSHVFEVKARDGDGNEDPTPALTAFRVLPPTWQEPWFLTLVVGFAGAIGFQTVRVIRRDLKLHQANVALEAANEKVRLQTERKSAFLASVSHEIRTPINAIKGFSSLVARREKALSERGKENLAKVGLASDYLLAMINDLLDLSKIEAGRMDVNATTFDVEKLIASCCETVSPLAREGVELRCEVDGVGEAHTDEQRVRQMVINLLSNAVKFTERGTVTVKVVRQESEKAKVKSEREVGEVRPLQEGASTPLGTGSEAGAQRADSRPLGTPLRGYSGEPGRTARGAGASLVISVSDTGKGIPEGEIATIFDEYRQVKGQSESSVQKGTGLGLSITKKFAELLGGTITVESEVGRGSTITVRIPANY